MEGIHRIADWNAIGAVVQALATVILVIITWFYVHRTREIAEQTRRQADTAAAALEEQRTLKRQKIKILRALTEIPPIYALTLEELAFLTGIDPDEIEGPLVTMMAEALVEIDLSGNYRLSRTKGGKKE
ncbi:MAG: hypothetical protein AB1393_01235 [Candidatus Edwardsbacteria bacterium]